MPEDIKTVHQFNVNVTCPFCNKKVSFNPHLSFKLYGKYSFTPHLCNDLDKYCEALLYKKCSKRKFSLSNKSLNDRRLKDWLIRNVVWRALFPNCLCEKKMKEIEKKIGFKIDYIFLLNNKLADKNDLRRIFEKIKN